MGKKRSEKRKKSSESDTSSYKHGRHDHSISNGHVNVSQILGETSAVLYPHEDLHSQSVFDSPIVRPRHKTSTPFKSQVDTENNMASDDGPCDPSNLDMKQLFGKIDLLVSSVNEIKIGQESLRKTLDSKIDKLRNDLLINIDQKVKHVRDEMTLELGRETARIDSLVNNINDLQSKVTGIEHSCGSLKDSITNDKSRYTHPNPNPLSDPDLTIIASGIPYTESEEILSKAKSLIAALGCSVSDNVTVTAAARLPSRIPNKPGYVKISFQSLDEKVSVLRNKMKLKDSEQYSQIFLKSSKSHAERLIEQNTRAILRELPHGRNFRLDANGRVKQRNAGSAPTPEGNIDGPASQMD